MRRLATDRQARAKNNKHTFKSSLELALAVDDGLVLLLGRLAEKKLPALAHLLAELQGR